MVNNGNILLQSILSKNKEEINTVRTLYLVMKLVGGYNQLMELSIPSINEIIKCMEWETKEQEKSMKKSTRGVRKR